MIIAITGTRTYENRRKIKDTIFQLKEKFGEGLVIVSGGSKDGTDRYVKKFTLDLGLQYIEYNPAYTNHNLYSALGPGYYGKEYHVTQLHRRNEMMVKNSDMLICFMDSREKTSGINSAIKAARRHDKKRIIIT